MPWHVSPRRGADPVGLGGVSTRRHLLGVANTELGLRTPGLAGTHELSFVLFYSSPALQDGPHVTLF